MALRDLLHNLPEVRAPAEKKVGFNVKLKWTLVILTGYFILSNIPLFGITEGSLARFEYLAILLGTSFGSIISLGIGPIVMAYIILQLLDGAQILSIDTNTTEGKKFFQALQKVLAFAFVIFEAMVYVLMKGIAAQPGFTGLVIFQLCVGGLLILFMDEVIQKWGFGSGVSLFIAAGVSAQIFIRAFSPLTSAGTLALGTGQAPTGVLFVLINSLTSGNTIGASLALAAIVSTIVVFLIAVYAQA